MADAARKVPSGTLLARDIRLLVTMNKQGEEICDAAIFVNSNEITWVGATADIPVEYSKADTIVSLPDRVVMPGIRLCIM
jgi:imidazolonepropionase-like amidohydrolase